MKTKIEIKNDIDELADFESRRDLVEMKKRELLDSVKVPTQVEALIKSGMERMTELDQQAAVQRRIAAQKASEALDKIAVPDEIKNALAEIDRQRSAVTERQRAEEAAISEKTNKLRDAVQADMQAETRDIYAAIEQRKSEIEAEFAGAVEAVNANILALKAEIEADVLALGETVRGRYKMAVWNKGRVGAWDSGKLDGLALVMPQIAECRKPGSPPTVTFRDVK